MYGCAKNTFTKNIQNVSVGSDGVNVELFGASTQFYWLENLKILQKFTA